MTGSSISIQKTETGWIINRGDDQFSVTDKNKDGKFDSDDLCKELSGKGAALNAKEMFEAKCQILQAGDGMTPAQMSQYSKYLEQKEASEKKEQQQIEYQKQLQAAQTPQKRSFGSKLLTGLTMALPFAAGIFSGIFGAGMNSWSRNTGNFNDARVGAWAGLSSGLLGFSTAALPLIAGSMTAGMQQNMMMPQTQSYGTGGNAVGNNFNFDEMFQSFNDDMAKQQKQYEDYVKLAQVKAEEQKNTNTQKARAELAEKAWKEVKQDNHLIAEGSINYNKLDSIYQVSGKEYTEEDERVIKQILAMPLIPYDAVAANDEEKGKKLDTNFAQKINDILKNRAKAKAGEENTVLPEADFKFINQALTKAQQGQLSENEMKKLNDIVKNNM